MLHLPKLKISVNKTDHRIGDLNAPISIVAYGDYESPLCAVSVSIFDDLINYYQQDLCFVYRHFPLSLVHHLAEPAGVAAEAANLQGKFWEMHRLLFQNQIILSPETIEAIAKTIELDMLRFNQDLVKQELLDRVQKDFKNGVRSGVNGMPTIFFRLPRQGRRACCRGRCDSLRR